jgi:predicted RNase H-like HicB family nuclease
VSAYDNDPRVRSIGTTFYEVMVGDKVYEVTARRNETDWISYPTFGSSTFQGLKTREETEAALESATQGPFASADEAFRSLIGDPR